VAGLPTDSSTHIRVLALGPTLVLSPTVSEVNEVFVQARFRAQADHVTCIGVCAVFVTAAFSFSGTELVGLAAAESENPQKHLPSAVKQVFWRISLFYILALT
jgi:amino acid permease